MNGIPTPDPSWLTPAIIGTLITAVVTVLIAFATLVINHRRARSDRQRELFGAAFGDVASYGEYPYIVRRRRADQPEQERLRISTELSEVQRRLNHNRMVLRVESPRVARAYAELVRSARTTAGASIKSGWDLDPIETDADMSVDDVDLSAMHPFEEAYLTAVADHLAITPWWIRACARSVFVRFRGDPVAQRNLELDPDESG